MAEAKSNLVLYSLSLLKPPLHLSNVILEASFAFEEECGLLCPKSSSNVCIRHIGDLPKELVPLAPYLNYTHGAKVHLHISNWNTALWGDIWKRPYSSTHGSVGAGAMLDVSTLFPLMHPPLHRFGTCSDTIFLTFLIIRKRQ